MRVFEYSLTWNQMAFTILLSTNKGRTQRALNTEVRINSNQDHTFPCREGSPKNQGNQRKTGLLFTTICSEREQRRNVLIPSPWEIHIPIILAVRVWSSGINTR